MPRDNGGVYSLPDGYLAVTGTPVLPSQHNPPLEDLAGAMSASLPRNGAAPMTGPIKAADGTVNAPGYSFASDVGTGIYKTANGFAVTIGGVKVAEFAAGGVTLGGSPIGEITGFGGSTAPAGWLLCAGQTVSRADYAALFAVIGTDYGEGDGSTTFALPDLRGRVPAGDDAMGGTAANRLQTVTTITTTNGSTTATVANGANLSVGMFITSDNVPAGTTLTARTGTTITMSDAATSPGSASAVFSAISGGPVLGSAGGAQIRTLTTAQVPQSQITGSGIVKSQSTGNQAKSPTLVSNSTGLQVISGSAASFFESDKYEPLTVTVTGTVSGGNDPHDNVQPTLICNYIIFAGA